MNPSRWWQRLWAAILWYRRKSSVLIAWGMIILVRHVCFPLVFPWSSWLRDSVPGLSQPRSQGLSRDSNSEAVPSLHRSKARFLAIWLAPLFPNLHPCPQLNITMVLVQSATQPPPFCLFAFTMISYEKISQSECAIGDRRLVRF